MKKKLGRVTELVDNIEVDLERMLKSKSIVLASQSNISDKNVKLNEVSMEDYFETQEQDIVNENIDTIYQHFQGFIAKHAEKFHSNILDVGCGIGKDFPRYFRLISGSYNYFGLDPIKINIKQRNYPLFCCGIEDLKKINLNKSFDIALFSSSLDHIEDISQALNILKEKVDGKVLIWIALQDSDMVALNYGEKYFKYIFSTKNMLGRFFRLLVVFLKGLRLLIVFSKLEKKLKKKVPLDPYHFHYFTKKSLFHTFEQHGEVLETLAIPGTNSMFVCLGLNNHQRSA